MNQADIDNCPSCGSGSARPIHRRSFQGRVWTLAKCPHCSLCFTSPTPTEQDMETFYAGDYHADLRREGGTEAAFGAKYRRYADTLGRHLRSGHVVDVGCSTGLLVRMLRDRGYDSEGVEMNAKSAAWGSAHYGVPIHAAPLEKSAFEKGTLDAVLLTDVLEHTRHPREYLRGVRELLAPGGLVLVTFPDIGSIESRFLHALTRASRREWMWHTCHVPLHVWEFTRRTAEACFAGAGFRVIEFRRSQAPAELYGPRALKILTWPIRALGGAPMAHRFGTQMEFVIQKTPEPCVGATAGPPVAGRRVAA
jgi:SAM-dependent methyltransferase